MTQFAVVVAAFVFVVGAALEWIGLWMEERAAEHDRCQDEDGYWNGRIR